MKTNCNRATHRRAPGAAGLAVRCCAASAPRRGIALVITLIMLSVTLVMAIAFLALARRERLSVSTTTDTTNAKLAADSALAAAQAQIMANILTTNTARYNFGLLISTNFINTNGFDPNVAGSNPTNVNYNHVVTVGGARKTPPPLSAADFIQNVANLQFLPRVPVFIQTNDAGSNDFRFYLDLNRNGQFDDTAYIDNTETNGPVSEIGDPQWIGVLQRPDAMHSADNQFVSRYAYIALPIGNGLDINAIHNQTATGPQSVGTNSASDGFFRNEGVGSWELNLAAFLADLNVNQWEPRVNPYVYNEASSGTPNTGVAFEDALSILSYRYNDTYNSLAVPQPITLYEALANAGIDGYTVGRLMTNTQLPRVNRPYNDANTPWAGSLNTNHFYNLPSDLFDPVHTSVGFTDRLTLAGNNVTNYDRYTFYRLLSQLGTDSDPDDGKMNLNYRNVNNGVVVAGMETNAYPWSPIEFFTNAADRMLRMYTTNWFAANPTNYLMTYYFITNNYSYYYFNGFGDRVIYDPSGFGLTNYSFSRFLSWTNKVPAFGITNIPVYVNGQFVYSPTVNRVLQLAANLYDASTNSIYPDVFRPIFEKDAFTNVFIIGFTNISTGSKPNVILNTVSGLLDPQLATPYTVAQLGLPIFPSNEPLIDPVKGSFVNVYGVPWIVGAKKGFPNFNKFGMQTIIQGTRKLQVKRSSVPTVVNSTTFQTNQLLAFNINNTVNAECWNSYSNRYQNPVNIYASDVMSMTITNNAGAPGTSFYNYQLYSNTFVAKWPGFTNAYPALSFTNALSGALILLTNSDFYFGTAPPGVRGFVPDSLGYGWESNNFNLQFPQFGLLVTNQLQLYMLDHSNGLYHVIDYVHFAGPQPTLNLSQTIESNNPAAIGYDFHMWSQSLSRNVPYGILSQISASELPLTANNGGAYWLGGPNSPVNQANIQGFATFMGLTGPYPNAGQNNPGAQSTLQYYATNYVVQVPYTPTVTISEYTSWQANDPLVHYMASDLNFNGIEKATGISTGVQTWYGSVGNPSSAIVHPSFTTVNDRYQPWGIQYTNGLSQAGPNAVVESAYGLAYKDPLVWGSDYWGFPTNAYPTVGWMGRVHRGTPWQTVYLKAHDILHVLDTFGDPGSGSNTWANWTGDANLYDTANSAPVQDRLLFDLFTTRPNDNAVLGTLSVNQTNLAAWSAVFSGMVAITNSADFPTRPFPTVLPTSYNWKIIQPAAVNGLLQTLVTNVNFAREGTNLQYGFTNADGVLGSFEHAGDILATPALTEYSPFLNWSNVNQQTYGISDAAYEWLPQQMMGLVRESNTPRYVIYAYGQALRPAVNGLVTSSANFGLVTNYQVVAESAVRAVVSVQAQVDTSGAYPVTNYTTRVESYNVLPPD